MPHGFLNLLKPPGMTSSDAAVWARRMLGEKRIGHAGTLDPEACGVLPLCVGRAAKLFDLLTDKEKVYDALLCLGVSTDTQDAQGKILSRKPADHITLQNVEAVLELFSGEIMQTPPAYAAVRVNGKRLYEYARSGKAAEVPSRPVMIHELKLLGQREDGYLLRIRCGKGAYIRTLCHDIGEALGVGGHMGFLVRRQSGPFVIEQSVTVEELKVAHERGDAASLLAPVDAPLTALPELYAPKSQHKRLLNGNAMPRSAFSMPAEGTYRLYLGDSIVGLAEVKPLEVLIKTFLIDRDDLEALVAIHS